MCGIVGYIGAQQAQDILLDGLSRLEYRGYDSAGIAVMDGGIIRLSKAKGRLANLAARVASNPLPGTIGIGHTRWATHGEPNDINAHPHTDMKGHIAVVHNGIIENYEELRAQLKAKGCVFVSETDTEVIAHLLHTLYDGDMLSTILRAQTMLEGSYALCVLNAEAPDTLYCTRKDSPLVVGLSDGAQYVGSDIPALIRHTRTVELLDEREVAVLTRSGVRVYDHFGNERALKPIHVDWDVEAAEKGGYAHFMLKEIHEEPAALKKTFSAHVDAERMAIRPGAFPISAEEANSLRTLTIVACGTAYHAGVVGKYVIEKLARLPVVVDVASEFRYRNPILGAGDCFLAISQSGETADTLAATREAERLGAKVMALTNVVGSSIARTAGDCVMYTYAGPEIAVATTKAYSTQMAVLDLLAVYLAAQRNTISAEEANRLTAAIAALPAQVEQILSSREQIQYYASQYFNHDSVFFIGRNLDYALGMEGSLKLKEISYIHSEAYASGELKHGTISLIEDGTLVIGVLTQPELYEKTFMFAFFIYAIIFNSLNTRSEKFNLFEHIGENKNFVLVMGAIFVLQTIIIEIGGKVFNTTLLEPKALLVSMVLAVLIIPVDLIRKAIMSR